MAADLVVAPLVHTPDAVARLGTLLIEVVAHGGSVAGQLPDSAYQPLGGLTGTRLDWKRIGPAPGSTTRACSDATGVCVVYRQRR